MIDNGMQDWLLAVSPKSAILIVVELIVCAIHPIPGDISFKWVSHDFQKDKTTMVAVPLDVVLSIPMFLRFYLLCRLVSCLSLLQT